tara:strand:+ start:297 stop:965 length:669 start_codon:yes stop_codon:yes gene_type:complete
MQALNEVWSVPDGDELITRKILEHKKPNSDPRHTNLYYERKVREAAISRVTNFGAFVDVGANVGIWSRPMSELFSKVHAFEPVEKNLECLNKNIENVNNIDIYTHGLSDRNSTGYMVQSVKNCGDCMITYNSRLKNRVFGPDDVVAVKTLDSHDFNNVGLIKIDTQGHELRVLKGAIETLKKNKPVVVFEINEDKDRCCDLMEALGASRVILKNKCLMLYSF